MKSLVLNSLFSVLLILSCTTSRYADMNFNHVKMTDNYYKMIFPDTVKSVKFKSEINIFKNYHLYTLSF